MKLEGGRELRARLKAIRTVFRPIGKEWADETVILAKAAVPVRTGRLQRSIRRRNASMKKATVVAHFSQYFIDKGTAEHAVTPRRRQALRWQSTQGNTVFAKRVQIPRMAARPFRERVAREALRRKPMAEQVIKLWNAAGQRGGLR